MHALDAINHLLGSHGALFSLGAPGDMVFFQQINEFLRDEIDEFAVNLLGRTAAWLGSIVLSLMTLWIMIQGYRIATGQSRDSMMALVSNSLRSVLIISIATAAAAGSSSVYRGVTDGLSTQVSKVVTGHDEDPYKRIDRSLWYMQLAMSSIDAVQDAGDPVTNDTKDRALWFSSLGTAGPAITGGTMLLLNKIAMALFVGLGPLFILCLLFDQTKPLFGRWLYYGLGTMFSLAVLSVMVSLALDMVLAVAAAFWTTTVLPIKQEGMLSLSMQQGGMGLILTMLIISAPPMAAMFFQGTLGSFAPGSAFDRGPPQRGPYAQPAFPQGSWASAGRAPTGAPPTASGPTLARVESAASQALGRQPMAIGGVPAAPHPDTIKQGTVARG
jgi:type IV secretion system protein VirB6